MKRHLTKIITVLFLTTLLLSCNQENSNWLLESPDQSITVEILPLESGAATLLYYTVSRKIDGPLEKIMDLSPLGLVCADKRFVENLEIVSRELRLNLEDSYTLVTGKQLDHERVYNALNLTFQNQNQEKISVVFRAYNDGIAFQYMLHKENGSSTTVVEEITAFDFLEGKFWGHPYDTLSMYTPTYETYYEELELGTSAP